MKLIRYIPFVLFILLSIFFYHKIKYQKKFEPLSSVLIEKPFPNLKVTSIKKNSSINDFIKNRPVIINIFASWCSPCRIEHKVFTKFSKEYSIIGIAYKDSEENVNKFLMELGNPYEKIFYDYTGKESINLGLYGVPETFFLNKAGKIVYKHVGPITYEEFEKIVPIVFN